MASKEPAEKTSGWECFLECKLCMTVLKNPLTLKTCLHTFCKVCIEAVPKKDQDGKSGWTCPTCEKFSIEQDIQQNTFIEDLTHLSNKKKLNKEKEKVTCQQCPKIKNESKWKCSSCKLEYCEDCKYVHLQIPMLKDHEFSTLEESVEVVDKVIFCSVHENKPIEFNCNSCDTLACSMCLLFDHNGHKCETITEALERLVPQIEISQCKVATIFTVKEAQLKAIMKKIEQTKEIYSSCRLELDERLEKLINNLKAMKAEMEDEVTEQETIALDILENLKQKYDTQINEAKHLTNLVKITMENAKHTSLLNEMQCGLYNKVNECGEQEQMTDNFKIKTPEFDKDQNLAGMLDELKELIGKLYYTEPLCAVNTSGLVWTEDEFICDDLSVVLDKSYTKVQETDLNIEWCNRMSFINNQIWVPCVTDRDRYIMMIYNELGQLVENINNDKAIKIVRKANDGDIIAGGKGLYVTNELCSMWIKIADGHFSDLNIHGNKIVALDFMKPAFKVLKKTNCNWEEIADVQLDLEMANTALDSNSTITLQNKHVAITSSDNDNNYYVINHSGNIVNKLHVQGYDLYWCGHDRNSKVLAACYSSGKLYIIDNVNKSPIELSQSMQLKMQCPGICDAIIDSHLNLWTLSGNDLFKLIKYSAV